jgi:hypothetical protein
VFVLGGGEEGRLQWRHISGSEAVVGLLFDELLPPLPCNMARTLPAISLVFPFRPLWLSRVSEQAQ